MKLIMVEEPDFLDQPKYHRQFQCPHCGRFAKYLGERQDYDGQGTQSYLSWSCSNCGDLTEGQW